MAPSSRVMEGVMTIYYIYIYIGHDGGDLRPPPNGIGIFPIIRSFREKNFNIYLNTGKYVTYYRYETSDRKFNLAFQFVSSCAAVRKMFTKKKNKIII